LHHPIGAQKRLNCQNLTMADDHLLAQHLQRPEHHARHGRVQYHLNRARMDYALSNLLGEIAGRRQVAGQAMTSKPASSKSEIATRKVLSSPPAIAAAIFGTNGKVAASIFDGSICGRVVAPAKHTLAHPKVRKCGEKRA
jgi:hypothetical protein